MVRFLPYGRGLVPWMFGCIWVLFWVGVGLGYCILVAVKDAFSWQVFWNEFREFNFSQFCSLAMVKSSPFQLLGGFTLLPRYLRSFSFFHVFILSFIHFVDRGAGIETR